MKILVTGAKGFVGKNLCSQLNNIKEKKANQYNINVEEVFEYDINSTKEQLIDYCKKADFVFNLAGINRPKDEKEFFLGNRDFGIELLNELKKQGNTCPVMISSSIQAAMIGNYANSLYGKSKKEGEDLLLKYHKETGAKVLIYRFPNLFGKWCKPNYNSVVATFCYNIANDLPININEKAINSNLNLVYIDDVVEELISALNGKEHHCDFNETKPVFNTNGLYCAVPESYNITLGELAGMIQNFPNETTNLQVPELEDNSLKKKLYSTYLSYLPENKMTFALKKNIDERGSFTELFRTTNNGQISVNVSKPGITKGEHWHHTKTERFCVIQGEGLIQMRNLQEPNQPIIEKKVSGNTPEIIIIPTGYTHNLINKGQEDMITIIWCNECFNPNKPDTFRENVIKE